MPEARQVDRPFHVTVVCTGNICRSPMGEVILRDLFREAGLDVTVDSAGTTRREVGSPMDRRAVAELRRRGYEGKGHVARQFEPGWFPDTDLVLAADAGHASVLRRWARTKEDAAKVHLLREFDPAAVALGPWRSTTPGTATRRTSSGASPRSRPPAAASRPGWPVS